MSRCPPCHLARPDDRNGHGFPSIPRLDNKYLFHNLQARRHRGRLLSVFLPFPPDDRCPRRRSLLLAQNHPLPPTPNLFPDHRLRQLRRHLILLPPLLILFCCSIMRKLLCQNVEANSCTPLTTLPSGRNQLGRLIAVWLRCPYCTRTLLVRKIRVLVIDHLMVLLPMRSRPRPKSRDGLGHPSRQLCRRNWHPVLGLVKRDMSHPLLWLLRRCELCSTLPRPLR
jgi:hypothetical protein